MQTSFQIWLESRDPQLYTLLEAEWDRRRSRSRKAGMGLGLAAAGLAAGLGWWGSKEDKPVEKSNSPAMVRTVNKTVEADDNSEPGRYKGADADEIFRYACERSHNGINIFPYNVGGRQKGIIARLSLPAATTSPLTAKTLNDRYFSFVGQIRATMKGRNVLKIDSDVSGQGPQNWQVIAKGVDNPNRSEAGMVEIVLYAPTTLGDR